MKTTSQAIKLTADYFKIVLEKVVETFLKKHQLSRLPKTFQLYGYGVYDEEKPNLKSDFEKIGTQFVNGKYLYDKSREIEKGKSFVKLNDHYTSIILLYIGYKNFKDFFNDHKISDQENKNQLALINEDDKNTSYYFVNYYFGEDNVILKGQSIISGNWKKIQHVFMYLLEDGTIRKHFSHGTIDQQGDAISIRTKTLTNGRYINGASEIYYTGHKALSNIKYFIGTYCNFDIYTNTVAGRSILEKCENREEMEKKSNDPVIPPYIALEIRNKRIVNKKSVPNHYLELSQNSPFSSIYAKIPGVYELKLDLDNSFNELIKFKITKDNYKIITLTENVYIEKDHFELLNKGTIINFRFNFSGIIALERVNIYFKTYYLKNKNNTQQGVFSGIDNENRLVNGTVTLHYFQDEK